MSPSEEFYPPLGCSVGPKADNAGVVGWIVMFNTPTRGNPMDWRERKEKTKRRAWDMAKSNRPPPIKTRKEVEGVDRETGAESPCRRRDPTQCHHSGGKGAGQISYIKLTLHRLTGNGASPRLQQVSYT